jgi:hypothetical protein
MNEVKCSVLSCSNTYQTEEPLSPNARFLCRKHCGKAQQLWADSHWEKERDKSIELKDLAEPPDSFYTTDWMHKPSPFTQSGSWTEFGSIAECMADCAWNIRIEKTYLDGEAIQWSPGQAMVEAGRSYKGYLQSLRIAKGYSL